MNFSCQTGFAGISFCPSTCTFIALVMDRFLAVALYLPSSSTIYSKWIHWCDKTIFGTAIYKSVITLNCIQLESFYRFESLWLSCYVKNFEKWFHNYWIQDNLLRKNGRRLVVTGVSDRDKINSITLAANLKSNEHNSVPVDYCIRLYRNLEIFQSSCKPLMIWAIYYLSHFYSVCYAQF